MAVSKKRTRTSSKARSTKPIRKVAETKAQYATRRKSSTAQVLETHLEFYITLPKQADVENFMDALIDLVESVGGSVGGGTITPEA